MVVMYVGNTNSNLGLKYDNFPGLTAKKKITFQPFLKMNTK